MLLLAAALLEAIIFVHVLHPYVALLCALIYALWYFDGKEYTGERRWEAFRALRVWRWLTPVEHHFPSRTNMRETVGRRLFVVVPCLTPSALVWAMGLHGGELQFKHRLHYVVPPPLMWIPLVRDILMWSGAITYSMRDPAHSLHNVLLDMLGQGHGVAYVPAQFLQHHGDLEASIEARFPTDELLQIAIKEQLQVVPVTVQGERERYNVVASGTLAALQQWTHARWNYPFPLLYALRVCSAQQPRPIEVQFGHPYNAGSYTDSAILLHALREHVDNNVLPSLGDKPLKDL
jgi:hypothetical protein